MSAPRVVHVWVRLDFDQQEHPGLVLDWRRQGDGWEALVTFRKDALGARAITDWVPSYNLRPATG